MSRYPILTAYPHLHHLLKNDPVANRQFNACLSEAASKSSKSIQDNEQLETDLRIAHQQLTELRADKLELVAFAKKAKTLLRRFGEVIEPQVHLTPYTEDIAEKKEYVIKFTADQIRRVLTLHWEVVAHRTEDIIAGRATDTDEEEQD